VVVEASVTCDYLYGGGAVEESLASVVKRRQYFVFVKTNGRASEHNVWQKKLNCSQSNNRILI
jgi:hypothetical protein